MSSTIIELRNVSKIYETEPLAGVRSINMSIKAGAITVVAGESGSGKSTLLKLISGLISPDSGLVLFKDEQVMGPEGRLIPGHDSMKTVAQDFGLNVYAKVYDNIAGLLPNTDLKAKRQKTLEVMEFLRIDHLAQKRAVDLSGGEQQRVAIARSIVTGPEVLLMDEPFSQVDSMLKNDLRADIRRMSQYLGITVILVSHDPFDGLSLADEIVILKDGRIIETGSPVRLYHHPQSLYTAQLLSNSNVLTREEAEEIGIFTDKDSVAILPEWIQFEESSQPEPFVVKGNYFKGFYEELIIERNGVRLRALNLHPGRYERGRNMKIQIDRFLEF